MPPYSFSDLGWTFETELDDATGTPAEGGLALKHIRHDAQNFANDVRFIGVWINLDQVDAGGKVIGNQKEFVA
jgi:hypothetical protein